MQLINALIFAGLATASGLHGRHAHLPKRQYGYGGGYGGGVNSTSVESASTVLSPTESSSLSSYGTGVETPSSIPSSAVYPTAASSASSSIGGTAVYPSSAAYPLSSLAGTGVETPASSTLAPVSTGTGTYPSFSLNLTTPASELTPVSTGVPGESYVTHVSDVTLTYTLGYGSSAHVVTTTIQETSTETIVKTVYLTKPQTTVNAAETPTGTTTISSTSTTTKFITVYPEASPISELSPTGTGVPGESGCAAPVYVTVTALETVTVTAGGYESSATEAAETSAPAYTSVEAAATPSSAAIYPSAPYGNGTVPSSIYAPSSGFLTFSKPASSFVAPTGTAPAPSSTGGYGYGGYGY